MSELLSDARTLEEFLAAHPICALYFSAPDCAVCSVLKPKLVANLMVLLVLLVWLLAG